MEAIPADTGALSCSNCSWPLVEVAALRAALWLGPFEAVASPFVEIFDSEVGRGEEVPLLDAWKRDLKRRGGVQIF